MRALTGSAIAACCTISLLLAPLAGARSDRGRDRRSQPSQPAQTQTTQTQTTLTSQPTPERKPAPAKQQQGSPSHEERPHVQRPRQGHHGRDAGEQQKTGEQQETAEQQGSDQKAATQQTSEAKRRAERSAKRSPAATAATTTTSAPAASTVASPPQAAAATNSQAAAPAQPAGIAPPAVTGIARQAAKRVRRAHARAHAKRATRISATASVGSALATSAAARKGVARTRRPAAPRVRASSTARPSPLARTITKIVSVVPIPVRVLIGLLAALALAMGVRTRVAAARATRLERQREQLLEDVGLLQTALLPVLPARLGQVATSAAYRPAAGPGAGGDFYDVFALEDGRIAIVLGDVSGHGREALPHTALVRFTLRAYLEAGLSPRGAVQTAGDVLERQLGESFATVVLATYEPRERMLTYSCAGHPPPVVLGAGVGVAPTASVTECSAPPLGVGRRTGTRQTVVSLPGAVRLCFHTDGVTEARVGAELFGEQRLMNALADLGPNAPASELLDRVAEQADRRPDDMAACVLSIEGGAEQPSVLVEELELDREEAASDRVESFLLACGVRADAIAGIVREARQAAGQAGSAILRLRLGDGAPEVSLLRDNLAYLPARRASRQAAAGASR